MNRLLLSLTLICLALPAQAQPAPLWDVIREDSLVVFEAKQNGAKFEGDVKIKQAIVSFSPDALDKSSVMVSVDIASMKTHNKERDEHIHGPAWFDAAQFPVATFESKSFEHKGGNQYIAHGHLTIRDVRLEKSVTFTFDVRDDGTRQKAEVSAGMALARLDYGVGQGEWRDTDTVANRVHVRILLKAERSMP